MEYSSRYDLWAIHPGKTKLSIHPGKTNRVFIPLRPMEFLEMVEQRARIFPLHCMEQHASVLNFFVTAQNDAVC